MNAGMRAMAAAAVLAASGMAMAADQPGEHAGQGAGKSATASPQTSNASTACRTLIKSMAGEWEGTIQTRNGEGMSSSSTASATLRLEGSGQHLAMYYEGFAFGKAAEGAMVLSAPTGSPRGALSRDGQTLSGSGSLDGSAMKFDFKSPDANKKIARYEQSVSLSESDHLVAELHAVDEAGTKSLAFRLDMTRLPAGQKSSASDSFAKSKSLLASAWGAIRGKDQSQQAGAPTE